MQVVLPVQCLQVMLSILDTPEVLHNRPQVTKQYILGKIYDIMNSLHSYIFVLCHVILFNAAASNEQQPTLAIKRSGNTSSNPNLKKQRVAMKKDLQRQLDHWDTTDKTR